MEQEQKEHFRKELLRQRQELFHITRRHSEHGLSGSEYEADVSDIETEANRSTESSKQTALSNSERQLLEKIDLAIRRLDDGSYGTCLECNEKIPWERLRAKPSVSLCLSCQEEKERRGKV